MNDTLWLRCFVSLLFAIASAIGIYRYNAREADQTVEVTKPPRYTPFISPWLLPLFLFCVSLGFLLIGGPQMAAWEMLSVCFGIFLHICVYYLFLLITLPLFRKFISARACAVLWLLPNYLYLTQMTDMRLPRPLWILHAPKNAVWIALWVWLAGFAAMLIFKIVSHLLFRRRLLKDAIVVTDPAVLNIWQLEQCRARFKKTGYRLMTSPNTATPISIGFFRHSIRVVLPERAYTEEELTLILRHEAIHIGRQDSVTKFFLVFCTAMCWFNPLMWLAMRRSADDLELSCDETVLLNANDDTRQQYASLLLRTAGDERGFTTCLSASAQALRYRLRNVIKPRKRLSGGITVGLIFFALILSCGCVSLSYDAGSGGDILFSQGDAGQYAIQYITMGDGNAVQAYNCTDEAALNAYLAGLQLSQITGDYTFPDGENSLFVIYEGPEGVFTTDLNDDSLRVTPFHTESSQTTYYFDGQIDWDYLRSLLTPKPEEPPAPTPPELNLYFDGTALDDRPISACQTVLSKTVDGQEQSLDGYQENWLYNGSGVGGVYGAPVTQVTLSFSQEPDSGYAVRIEDWEHTAAQTVSSQDLEDAEILPLAPYSAHYTVCAAFTVENTVFQMEYCFDVRLPEDAA